MKAFIPAISPLFGRPMASLGPSTARVIEPKAMTSSANKRWAANSPQPFTFTELMVMFGEIAERRINERIGIRRC